MREAGVLHSGRVRLHRVRDSESPGGQVLRDTPGSTETRLGPQSSSPGARAQTHPGGSGSHWVSAQPPWAGGSATPPPPQAIMGRGAGAGEHSLATAVGISQHGPKRGELEGGIEGARRRRRPPAHPAPCATGRGPGPRGGAGWRAWHCTAQCRVPDLVLCVRGMAV